MLLTRCYIIILSALFFTMGLPSDVIAQYLKFRHYTIADGLPSSETFDIQQDMNGFIWVTTDNGICKFDGKQFTTFPIKYFTDNLEIKILSDKKERMWIIDLEQKGAYLYKNQVIRLNNMQGFKGEAIRSLYEDKKGNVWFNFRKGHIIKYNNHGTITPYDFPSDTIRFFVEKNEQMYFFSYKGYYTKTNEKFEFIPHQVPFSRKIINNRSYWYGDKLVFFDRKQLYTYNWITQRLELLFPSITFKNTINDILFDKQGNCWVLTRKGIGLIQQGQDNMPMVSYHLADHFFNKVLEDREGNIWFSTRRDGLFLITTINGYTLQQASGLSATQIEAVMVDNKNRIIIGSSIGQLDVIQHQNAYKSFQPESQGVEFPIYDIAVDHKGEIWVAQSQALSHFDQQYNLIKTYHQVSNSKCVVEDKNHTIWVGTGMWAGYLRNNQWVKILQKRTYSILPIDTTLAYFGTIDGLILYNSNAKKPFQDILPNQRIEFLGQTPQGEIWVATKGHGISIFKGAIQMLQLTTKDGLSSNFCKKIIFDKKYAWISTDRGISRIDLETKEILNIDDNDGLPSNDITAIGQLNHQLLVGTNKGLSFVDKNQVSLFEKLPRLHITKVKIHERDTSIQSFYHLPYYQNNIKLEFIGIHLKRPNDVSYQYQMKGVDAQWVTTDINMAAYPSLPSGKFEFRVRTKTKNTDWSKVETIHFSIAYPFWKKTWFYILLLGGIVAIMLGGFQLTLANLKHQNAIQSQLRSYQLTALRARMNPHFLFNSLNSIQDFILDNDMRSANRYLSKFAKLMRNILNMSADDVVSLEDELDTLKLYLQIEAMRFEEGFDYSIDVERGLDVNRIFVPTLLIQPYLENAIKHGLMHKKGHKQLDLRFYAKENLICCEIEDNGIGRKQSALIQQNNFKEHRSVGMKVSAERLRLFNTLHANQVHIKVVDLENEKHKALGTKVILYLHKMTKKSTIAELGK